MKSGLWERRGCSTFQRVGSCQTEEANLIVKSPLTISNVLQKMKTREAAQGRQQEELQTTLWGRLDGGSKLGWQQDAPCSAATTLGQLRARAGRVLFSAARGDESSWSCLLLELILPPPPWEHLKIMARLLQPRLHNPGSFVLCLSALSRRKR